MDKTSGHTVVKSNFVFTIEVNCVGKFWENFLLRTLLEKFKRFFLSPFKLLSVKPTEYTLNTYTKSLINRLICANIVYYKPR